jgi:hypothetical protein
MRSGKTRSRWRNIMSRAGIVGVSDRGGWAVLVTADAIGRFLIAGRVGLVDEGLPKIPHQSEGQVQDRNGGAYCSDECTHHVVVGLASG